MIAAIINKLSLPDNLFVYALLETLVIFLTVLIAGFVINLISNVITGALSALIGPKPAFVIRNYATYIGTVHHEFAHAIFGIVTGAKVTKIILFPKGDALGSVELETRGNILLRSLQLSFSAVAPVVMGTISLFLLWQKVFPNLNEIWHYILFWYVFVSILLHMTMSGQDYRNFFKGLIPSALLIFIIFLILGIFGIRI